MRSVGLATTAPRAPERRAAVNLREGGGTVRCADEGEEEVCNRCRIGS